MLWDSIIAYAVIPENMVPVWALYGRTRRDGAWKFLRMPLRARRHLPTLQDCTFVVQTLCKKYRNFSKSESVSWNVRASFEKNTGYIII